MNNGDFIEISFEMRAGADKKLISTSKEELAKENNIYDEKKKYRDIVMIVGQDGLFKEINDSFLNAEVGKEYEVVVPAKDAYGERDPKNIKVVPMREFQKNNINPEVGQQVNIGNKIGKVITVTPGRVLIDYNHELAGKDIYYKYEVKKVVTDPVEKVKALIDMDYNDSSEFDVKINENIEITIPENAKFDAYWVDAKYRLVNDIRKYLPDYDVYIKEFYKKEEKKEEKPEEQKNSEKTENNEKPENNENNVKETQ
ncbi:FKBP-type peptidyl-prolyl cis-trans isomerase [Picrophilus oshimae]|uniref:peptidylprolyl isomerase n=1 Tax=Picrophilus torridus (strain ATCC 700027 / DSM 9790 / JCM 10055 / NBRC 100828 / KAW 2/3) TaxID=1122961 RepID=Q6L289_PICTO|nr:peptidylprolyl isomerase [Picrophilus oshimae]AAT42913.1 peptidyl-prolyl cis-trans isomerase [Picrophilus oshimae DSM 9789]